jgi:hemoglobin
MVLGGPNNYTGKDMRTAHAPLVSKGLNDSHVDVVIEHLGGVLKELGANDAQIAQVAALANSVRDDVLSRSKA